MAKKFWITFLPILCGVGLSLTLTASSMLAWLVARRDVSPPLIQVWYGPRQAFGQAGLAQRWVNVLGNAADPQSQVRRLEYRLNGGRPVALSLGPDERRLANAGDFNVEIDRGDLREGQNQVAIEATNGAGLKSSTTVIVDYHPALPGLPYHIDWARVHNHQQVLQIVDGRWRWDASGIRPAALGYDRMLALGDVRWTNYQVRVLVTVHSFDRSAFQQATGGRHAGVSVDLRWLGHSDAPAICPQPHCGWDPVGNFNKFFYKSDGVNYLGLKVREKEEGFPTLPYQLLPGHTYIFQASVQTSPRGNLYRMKVWEAGAPEPPGWGLQHLSLPGSGSDRNPAHGAIALVAHHADVTFGNIDVVALPPLQQ